LIRPRLAGFEVTGDKLTADMAHELRDHHVTVVWLYPELVRTEKVMDAAKWLDTSNSESPQFIGRAVAALATDPSVTSYLMRCLEPVINFL